ncbi:MAG: hypothetical protein ACE5JA_04670 [bacterium]
MSKRHFVLVLILICALMFLGCAPGNERWDQDVNPGKLAGFWAGLWHGLIIVITFIVSLFTDEVGLYEISNTGWPYNLGFLIGLSCSVGGGIRIVRKKRRLRKDDWDRIGREIEQRVREGLGCWLDETRKEEKEREWEEIARRIEEKIKRVLEDWTDRQ